LKFEFDYLNGAFGFDFKTAQLDCLQGGGDLKAVARQSRISICAHENVVAPACRITMLVTRQREQKSFIIQAPAALSLSLFHSPFNCQRVKTFSMPRTPMSEKAFYSFILRSSKMIGTRLRRTAPTVKWSCSTYADKTFTSRVRAIKIF